MVSVDVSSLNATRISLTHQTTIIKKTTKETKRKEITQKQIPHRIVIIFKHLYACARLASCRRILLQWIYLAHQALLHKRTHIQPTNSTRNRDLVRFTITSIRFDSIRFNRFTPPCVRADVVVDCTTFSWCHCCFTFNTFIYPVRDTSLSISICDVIEIKSVRTKLKTHYMKINSWISKIRWYDTFVCTQKINKWNKTHQKRNKNGTTRSDTRRTVSMENVFVQIQLTIFKNTVCNQNGAKHLERNHVGKVKLNFLIVEKKNGIRRMNRSNHFTRNKMFYQIIYESVDGKTLYISYAKPRILIFILATWLTLLSRRRKCQKLIYSHEFKYLVCFLSFIFRILQAKRDSH